ncbi:MAG: OmpH family outer membrane protein [Alphaproteobacteria bacterium]|nr:OmpH family outer membrane protein [Alphaproteobacteria bacterium]
MVLLFPRAAWRLTALTVALISFTSMAMAQQQPRPAQPAKPAQQPAAPAATPAAAPAAPKQPAGPLPTPVIAVVDVDKIRENAAAAKSVRDQLVKQQSAYQDEIAKTENDLRNAEQDLNKQRTVLAPEAFADRRQKFEQRVAEFQRSVQARRKQLDDAYKNSMVQVNTVVVQVIQDVATARGASLMLPRSQIILSHPSMEVTDEVLEQVNRKLPTVKVTLPPLTQ